MPSSSSSGSPDASGANAPAATKKRRLPGACDACKKKKVRCDSGQMPGNRCTNCINAGAECTHVELTRNLGSAKGYVENLEQRLEKMEQLLNKLVPGIDLNRDEEIDPDVDFDRIRDAVTIPRNDDDDISTSLLTFRLKKVEIDPTKQRFFGKSSGFHLIQTALHHKNHYAGGNFHAKFSTVKRPEYWEVRPFQEQFFSPPPNPQYVFPDEDLMHSLIELYFRYTNIFYPILHRPTFEDGVAQGLHRSDTGFGGTVLMVCAVGSRWSDDLRIYLEGGEVPASAGWRYFCQVPPIKYSVYAKSSFAEPTLYELQICALSCLYSQSAVPVGHGGWVDIGLGVRIAQDVGSHRETRGKRGNSGGPNSLSEMWKRVFFVLLSMDRHVGAFKGRPTTMIEEEFDLDYPVDCDDEYWDHPDPELNFKQPKDKPSMMSYFIYFLGSFFSRILAKVQLNVFQKLMDILAYTMRTIYACRKPKSISGKPWYPSEQEIIAELDSAMNQWLDSLPPFLRWDPNRENDIFFQQSAMLYTTYYEVQILIHKPFIPTPRVSSALSFPSLTICTNAARSCNHIARLSNARDRERGLLLPNPYSQRSLFTSAVVTMLSIWSGHRAGMGSSKSDFENVQITLDILKTMETRHTCAGRLWDILHELSSAGEQYAARERPENRNKRPREEENGVCPSPLEPTLGAGQDDRQVAGSRRVSRSLQQQGSTTPPAVPLQMPSNHQQDFALPLFGNQLVEVPLYDAVQQNGTGSHSSSEYSHTPPLNQFDSIPIDLGTQWDYSLQPASVPVQGFHELNGTPAPMHYDNNLWSAVPAGLDYDDWGTFINNFSQSWGTTS